VPNVAPDLAQPFQRRVGRHSGTCPEMRPRRRPFLCWRWFGTGARRGLSWRGCRHCRGPSEVAPSPRYVLTIQPDTEVPRPRLAFPPMFAQ
jgi:hypothetical protein